MCMKYEEGKPQDLIETFDKIRKEYYFDSINSANEC